MDYYAVIGAMTPLGIAITQELLAQGKSVKALVNKDTEEEILSEFYTDKNIKIVRTEFLDWEKASNSLKGCKWACFCIRFPLTNYSKYLKKITENIKRGCELNKCSLFFASSSSVYTDETGKKFNEKDANPASVVGREFLKSEKLLNDPLFTNKFSVVVFRLPLVFGAGLEKTFIDKVFRRALKSKRVNWPFNLDSEIETVYSKDVAKAVLKVIFEKENGFSLYNYSNNNRIKAQDFIKELFRASGNKLNIAKEGGFSTALSSIFDSEKKHILENRHLFSNTVKLDTTKFEKEFGKQDSTLFSLQARESVELIKKIEYKSFVLS